jgi:hypothetical protein
VAPAILELTEFHHSKKASERTKVTICLNTCTGLFVGMGSDGP